MKTFISTAVLASILVVTSYSRYAAADDTTPPRAGSTGTSGATGATPSQPSATATPSTIPTVPAPSASTTLTSGDPNDSTVTPAPLTTPVANSHESVTLYDKHTPNKALLFTGVGIFAGSYVTTAAITAANVDTLDKSLYLPIVGPWLTLAQASDYSGGKTFLIAGSGVLQGVGAGMALVSLFVPEKTATTTITAGNVKMNIVPNSYGPGSAGVGAIGTF